MSSETDKGIKERIKKYIYNRLSIVNHISEIGKSTIQDCPK